MDKKISLSLVIPTYNDELVILKQIAESEKILKRLCRKYEIIIADDKSQDKTFEVLIKKYKNNKNFKIFQNKKNKGITKNVQQLYKMANNDYVLFYSADGDWKTEDMGKLIETQLKKNSDIVIGKRIKKVGYTNYRNFISYMHRLLPILFFGVDTIDPGGIKLIKKDLISNKILSKSQLFEAEIIIRAIKSGAKIDYYPVSYKKPKTGAGYGGAFKSAFESFIDLLVLRLIY